MAVDPGFDATLMLAANVDRERAIGVLQGGFAEGRLTKAEYDDRTARVYAARTYGELGALVADLPAGPLASAARYPDVWYPPQQVARTGPNSMALAGLILGWTGIALISVAVAALIIIAGRSGQPAPAHAILPVVIKPVSVPLPLPANPVKGG